MNKRSVLQNLQADVFSRTNADSSILGDGAFEVAVARRMSATGSQSLDEYTQLYYVNQDERQLLLDESTVPETWFFRDTEAYPLVSEHLLAKHPTRTTKLNLLSLPCATGEEAYSLAALMSRLGLTSQEVLIHGVDISSRSVQHASRGVYGKYSLRGEQYPGTEQLLIQDGSRWIVDDKFKPYCSFSRASAFEYLPPRINQFTVAFCRNLLIYFNSEKQQELLSLLVQSLEPGGVLVLSPAEAPLLHAPKDLGVKRISPTCFERIGVQASFAIQVPNAIPLLPAKCGNQKPTARSPHPLEKDHQEAAQQPIRRQVNTNSGCLSDLKNLYHQRSYSTTFEQCTDIIEGGEATVETYLLAAYAAFQLNYTSAAENALRRVLYLDPHHEETLLQLALLAVERGDDNEAARLRARALRSHERSEGRE